MPTFCFCFSVLQCGNKEVRQRWFDSQPFAKYVHDLFMKQINPENLCHRRISDISPLKAALICLWFGDVCFLRDVTDWESKRWFPLRRSFRRSTASSSWTKEDLWWPSDTLRCQLGTFGEGLPSSDLLLRSGFSHSLQVYLWLVSPSPNRCSFPPRLSFDEGRNWDKYSFTSSPLYVDGVLGEPGEDILIMT